MEDLLGLAEVIQSTQDLTMHKDFSRILVKILGSKQYEYLPDF